MKKGILLGIALLMVLVLLPACASGVPQEEYERVSNELIAAQTQTWSLQDELTTAQTQIQSLQDELSAKESQLEATQEKLEQGKARIEILNAIFIPAMTGELDAMTEAEAINFFFEWRDTVKAIEDPVLTAKFEAMIETFSDEALLSFFVYLLESTADALR
jgi:hypothetical protein